MNPAPVLLCVLAALPAVAQHITVVSWGGSYARACQEAFFRPFTAETGIEVRVEDYNGGLAGVRAQAEAGNVHWDVVDLDVADAVRGCDEGIFEPFDHDRLPEGAAGEPAADDFYPGTLTDCGVGTLFASTVIAYNTERTEAPGHIADFFDLEGFPGRRGMRRTPRANLEFALLADGVAPDEVYATLDTPAGKARAFARLDTIKPQVVWWDAGAQPPQMLADGEVVMSTAYNGRIFNAQVLENQPLAILWKGQLLYAGQFAIVAGTPRLEAAERFVRFAARPQAMADIGKYISSSPARRSAQALVGAHLATGVDMASHMPTSAANAMGALRLDWRWWSDNDDEMNERFSAWLAR